MGILVLQSFVEHNIGDVELQLYLKSEIGLPERRGTPKIGKADIHIKTVQ
jgi:hypothetical protein